jgi:CheY-like chemotaxis protein
LKDSNARPLVLILDADPDTVAIVETLLESAGYRTEFATDVESAIDKALIECPAVIMTDLFGVGGIDAFEQFREHGKCAAIPVVMMTTDFGASVPVSVPTPMGTAAVVRKPLDLREVVDAIDLAISQ